MTQRDLVTIEPVEAGDGAVVIHAYNVMDIYDRTKWQAKSGLSLLELAPKTKLPTLCHVNGELFLKEDWWQVEPLAGDVVTFQCLPLGGGNGGGGSLQIVVGIVLIVVGAFTYSHGGGALIAAGFGMIVSGLVAPPSIAPIANLQSAEAAAASPTYNIQLSGNSARLGQPLPVLYGEHIITPDFASAPYQEYDELDNQYYHAILCFGVMDKFTVLSVMIDDTVLEHFTDFETQYIGPQYGISTPTLVNPAVVTAPEVASQELLQGVIVGPFAANGPGLRAVQLGFDIICPKGLYFADDTGNLIAKSCSFLFEARAITDSGTVAGDWFLLGYESITLAQNSQVRRSYKYNVPPARYEIRAQRIDTKDLNARAGHEVSWAGLRAYMDTNVPLDSRANFLCVRIKANNQLSGLSQRKIALIIKRWLPTWNPTTGWSAPVATNSIAWVIADICKNPEYSLGLPDSRIDLQTLYALDQLWQSRGDQFNGVFDKRITVWQALTTVARCGRARPIMRGNVFTFVRDEKQVLPAALFGMRNIKRGSFAADYAFQTEDSADGVEVEFFNHETWSSDWVRLPAVGVTESLFPAKVSLPGVTNRNQALRECAYYIADSAYRTSQISFVTEMEGYLPAFGDLVLIQHDVVGWGIGGELEEWDSYKFEAISTEELVWSVGNNYCVLTDEYGDVHGPYLVATGQRPRSMVFLEAPDMTPYIGTEKERTKFAMGPANLYAKRARIVGLTPNADNTVKIEVVVEDDRVHGADEAYSGSGSGGGIRLARYAPDGIPIYNSASDAQHNSYGFFTGSDRKVGSRNDDGYLYN